MLLPFFEQEIEAKTSEPLPNSDLEEMIKTFFSPFKLPKFFKSKIHNVLMMQPYFGKPIHGEKIQGHPNFNQAKETYSVFAEATKHLADMKLIAFGKLKLTKDG